MIIAFEGIDGSGKGTQGKLLERELLRRGRSSTIFSFPQYGKTVAARKIETYLNGSLPREGRESIFAPALLFALDRFEVSEKLRIASESGMVIADRYVFSNIAHQSAKSPPEWSKHVVDFILDVEFKVLRLPPPDITIFLNLDPEEAWRRILQKGQRSYTDRHRDIHEDSLEYLQRVSRSYLHLAQNPPFGIVIQIDMSHKETIESIHQRILTELSIHLDLT